MIEFPEMKGVSLFWQLTKRHLLVFFRNKIRIFFTLMVPFIIFVIYILFLRDLELSSVNSVIAGVSEEYGDAALKNLTADPEFMSRVRTLIDSWMLSGIIAITTITVSLQTNTIIVADRETGVNKDFASSPISRNLLIGSYFLFNLIVTVLICFIFLLVCIIYLACLHELNMTFVDFLSIFGILVYSSVVSVLFTVFISSFVSRDATMASITTITSTAIGFLIGAYMPFAMLPKFVQNICVFVPGTFSCSLLRYSFMATPLSDLTSYLAQNPELTNSAELIRELMNGFGYNVEFFGMSLTPWMQAIGQLIVMIIFLVLNIVSGKHVVKVIGDVGKKFKKKK